MVGFLREDLIKPPPQALRRAIITPRHAMPPAAFAAQNARLQQFQQDKKMAFDLNKRKILSNR
ncbi:MAG: hypothetical protein EBV03_00880 [Proteobacteria bacterium]|nr:hypothetical protein [Pseudomonadota bacterium]